LKNASTGEIGSGKSTALRYVTGMLHPSQYRTLYITASTGSILELYRQLLDVLGMEMGGVSRAVMLRRIRQEILELVQGKKLKMILIIDEASLLRLEVFAELHTLTQFEKDSKPLLPIVLAGQSNLIDNLMYRSSLPLASRIVGRSHLDTSPSRGLKTTSSMKQPLPLSSRVPVDCSEKPTT
jgi:type II secretory pathway predicted ATPase ExeA